MLKDQSEGFPGDYFPEKHLFHFVNRKGHSEIQVAASLAEWIAIESECVQVSPLPKTGDFHGGKRNR
jgi:hypothetical protein